ncbi:hypothetical protein KGY58_03130 [Candidatus Bipolaricaulota bacterium]|nr:hypothetical protein [Candidatus Bipolaricaulota bacterium]
MKNNLNKEELKAIAEAPEEVRKNWSRTQRYIAEIVEDLDEEIRLESFDGGGVGRKVL